MSNTGAEQESIDKAVGQSGKSARPDARHPRWIRIFHWTIAAGILTLAFTGIVIFMAHPRLYWGEVGNDLTPALLELPVSRNYQHGGWEGVAPFFDGASSPVSASRTYEIFNLNSWGRSLHFLAAWCLVLAGLIYVAAGIFTGHVRRHLLPAANELSGRSLWRDLISHARLQIRPARGGPPYGLLQKCAYLGVIFFALPLVVITGLAMSPAITAAYPFLSGAFGGVQSARTIHFFLFVAMVVFLVVHVLMVIMSGFSQQIRAMTFGDNGMTKNKVLIGRRNVLAGLGSMGGLLLSGCEESVPPTYGNILRMGDVLTYKAHRLLLPAHSLVKEYDRRDISSMPAIGTTNPADPQTLYFDETWGEEYQRLRRGGFSDWRLSIEGSVARPGTYSLSDLKKFPSRTQITKHYCEEGWSAIAEWTGVPLRSVLEAAGILPSARFVNFYTYDFIADGIDMIDAMHPQTVLAYGMNGRDLTVPHGAPVRLRLETQVGYKSTKFLRRIVVSDEFDDLGKLGPLQNGWSWYAGI